jgi:hypothetical protein
LLALNACRLVGHAGKEGREPRCSHEISLMIRESVNVLIPEVKATRNREYYYNSHSGAGGVQSTDQRQGSRKVAIY